MRCGSVKCLQYLKWIHNRRSQVPNGVSLVLVSDTFLRKSCLIDVTVIKIVYCRNFGYFDRFSYLLDMLSSHGDEYGFTSSLGCWLGSDRCHWCKVEQFKKVLFDQSSWTAPKHGSYQYQRSGNCIALCDENDKGFKIQWRNINCWSMEEWVLRPANQKSYRLVRIRFQPGRGCTGEARFLHLETLQQKVIQLLVLKGLVQSKCLFWRSNFLTIIKEGAGVTLHLFHFPKEISNIYSLILILLMFQRTLFQR